MNDWDFYDYEAAEEFRDAYYAKGVAIHKRMLDAREKGERMKQQATKMGVYWY